MALTKTQLETLKVGQELFWENGQGRHHWNSCKVIIEKIGNKYAYAGRLKISLEDSKIFSDSSWGCVWYSEQDYYDKVNLDLAWSKFRMFFVNSHQRPNHLTLDVIRELSERVGII
jgi:hypothetical protein